VGTVTADALPAETQKVEETALWISWKRRRDALARTKIILGYLPFAKGIARSVGLTINPDYVEKITDDEVIFRNYEGQRFVYPLKSTPVAEQAPVENPAPAVPYVVGLKD